MISWAHRDKFFLQSCGKTEPILLVTHHIRLHVAYCCLFAESMLNSLVQGTPPGGAGGLNANGLDLPGAGPNVGLPPQPGATHSNMPSHSMSGAGTLQPGNMPPPTWPQQQQPNMVNPPLNPPQSGAMLASQQPKPQIAGLAPGPSPGSSTQQLATGGGGGASASGNMPISAPEMKKAYDALGLAYPGAGGGLGSANSPQILGAGTPGQQG